MALVTTAGRGARACRKFLRGLLQTEHPLLVHIIPIRRCNIDCGYCNEYDKVSPPVPFDTLTARIDKLAELGTSVVAFSGGEPLLHPQLDDLIRHIRSLGMMSGLITNGFLLSVERIKALNAAGLDYMQISIDNVVPDDVSKKSLKTLDAPDKDGRVHSKLKLLRAHATFQVNINSVLGGGTRNPEDARTINRRARELGFTTSIGIIHDGLGQLKPLGPVEREIYDDVSRQIDGVMHVAKNLYSGIRDFQLNLVDGKPNEWHCRAGARYLYICENGLVHYCSQQRGVPGIPLEKYSLEHIRREFNAPKSCAPYCTIGCVHRVSFMDFWRKPQTGEFSI
ncbi:MAG TPA: radical SAM protein [Vicinamibacterales bacterium]|nr:radical SAM protein [Vicinamibacterales bacterium]